MNIFSKKNKTNTVPGTVIKKNIIELDSAEKKSEDWMQSKWRPAMGWMYMIVCVFDFVVFPMMYTIVQFWETEAANDAFRQWQPLTLAGAGLFHMAMGAVLGLSAWGRTQEKLNGSSIVGLQTMSQSPVTIYGNNVNGMTNPPVQNFNAGVGGFENTTPVRNTGSYGHVTTGFGGKPAPVEPPREWI